MNDNRLKKRIIEISYKNKLSHLGSCLTALPIIDEIYSRKESNEKFVLSSGHAALALYVVLEKYISIPSYTQAGLKNGMVHLSAEKIFNHHGVHPDRCAECFIDCSSGSLGQGLPIAVGMALANRSKKVYCLISDGECAEGSIWEALTIAQREKLGNLHVYVNMNGWGAYDKIDSLRLKEKLKLFGIVEQGINPGVWMTNVNEFPFLKEQDAHYYTMNDEDYRLAISLL